MSSPDALIKATLNRLAARVGHGVVDAAAGLAVLAQDAPARLRQEWELFQEEVKVEADHLENQVEQPSEKNSDWPPETAHQQTQEQIDRLRAMVADLSAKVEAKH